MVESLFNKQPMRTERAVVPRMANYFFMRGGVALRYQQIKQREIQ